MVESNCIFCQIAAGEVSAALVHQDGDFVAFRDINPQAPTHVLVIPRQHLPTLNDARDPELVGRMLLFAREVAQREGLAERGYRLVINTNAQGGQTVFHLHLHLLGGRPMRWPPG
jgi:histidine triad (HIT) family protein